MRMNLHLIVLAFLLFGQDLLFAQSKKETIKLTLLDSNINFETSCFALNYFGDEMSIIFSAAGLNGLTPEGKKKKSDYSDIYLGQRMIDGDWGETTNTLLLPVNSEDNESGGVLSVDKTTFYFTRESKSNANDVAIYLCKYYNNQWFSPLKIDNKINVEGYKSMHPSLSTKGNLLYFSSNRPGGKGGMDIWYCKIDSNGLSEPINLESINTVGDEVTPFFNASTNTLYFSSDSLAGLGGLDIYKATYNEDEKYWENSKNLGEPFNSAQNDAYYIIHKNQKTGFLSSDRVSCEGNNTKSNYCYKIYEFGQPRMNFSIMGTVFNAETDDVVPNATITIKDIRGKRKPLLITTDAEGNYQKNIGVGWELFLQANKDGYFKDAVSVSTVGLTDSQNFMKDFYLSPESK